ncbi:MAG: hypothetical protein ACR2MB_05080 [Acidimicrobiales bacterium]
MDSLDAAQLSSLAAGIEDLADRSASLADGLDGGSTSDTANALYEAERSLRMAVRAVERGQRSFGTGGEPD